MNKMDKIYEQAKDQHVVASIIYNNQTDDIAYKDSECTTPLTPSELKELFLKGALININRGYFGFEMCKPIKYVINGGDGFMYYIKHTDGVSESEITFIRTEASLSGK